MVRVKTTRIANETIPARRIQQQAHKTQLLHETLVVSLFCFSFVGLLVAFRRPRLFALHEEIPQIAKRTSDVRRENEGSGLQLQR